MERNTTNNVQEVLDGIQSKTSVTGPLMSTVEADQSLSSLAVQTLLEINALVKAMLKNATWLMQPIAMDFTFAQMATNSRRHALVSSAGQQSKTNVNGLIQCSAVQDQLLHLQQLEEPKHATVPLERVNVSMKTNHRATSSTSVQMEQHLQKHVLMVWYGTLKRVNVIGETRPTVERDQSPSVVVQLA